MMEEMQTNVLRELALKGCLDDFVVLRTADLAKIIGKSQQSASSYLIQLEKTGWIHRTYGQKSLKIKIAEEGRKILMKEFIES